MKKATFIILLGIITLLNLNCIMAQELTLQTSTSKQDKKFTILVLYRATNYWLSLNREERNQFTEKELSPILQKFEDRLKVRFYDSEAFHAKTSDFLIVETKLLKDFYFFMEYIRDTKLFTKPYIELNDIILGIEGGFEDFEKTELKNN